MPHLTRDAGLSTDLAIFGGSRHPKVSAGGIRCLTCWTSNSCTRCRSTVGRPSASSANVLGVSDQTVARRYDRHRSSGLLRVRGLLEPSKAGRTQWIVRIRCTPGTSAAMADALARSVDISWISLISGGAGIVCVLSAPSDADPATLLTSLPLARGVLAIDAHCVLHEYFGGTMNLINKNGPLTWDQIEALGPRPDGQSTGPGGREHTTGATPRRNENRRSLAKPAENHQEVTLFTMDLPTEESRAATTTPFFAPEARRPAPRRVGQLRRHAQGVLTQRSAPPASPSQTAAYGPLPSAPPCLCCICKT
jgi:hypothetical protein